MATYNFLDKTGLGLVWAKIKALIPTKTSDLQNDSGFITSSSLPTVPDDLGDLTDTAISSPSNGQVLKYNSTTSKWVNSDESKEVMVVFPTDINQGIYTFNKTFLEIYSHLNNGGIAILLYTSGGTTNIYEVSNWDSSYIYFTHSVIYSVAGEEEYDYEVYFYESGFYIYSNNTGEYLGGTNGVISNGANLNGNITSFPEFYAPTTAGTSGQVLKSTGSGAPVWAAETDEVMVINITETVSGDDATYSADKTFAEIYAHLSAGNTAVCKLYGSVYQLASYDATSSTFKDTTIYGNLISGNAIEITSDDRIYVWRFSNTIPSASSTAPSADGAASVGSSTNYARADHVHPKITQAISMSNNVITLTGSDGTTSSVTLPVYNGGVVTPT